MKILSKYALFLLCYLFICLLASNDLFAAVNSQKITEDSLTIATEIERARKLIIQNPSEANIIFQETLRASKASRFRKGEADSYNFSGDTYKNRSLFDSAIILYQLADSIYKLIDDKEQRAHVLNNISTIYGMTNDIVKARAFFRKSYQMFRAINNTKGMGQTLHNIGVTHDIAGKRDSAVYYYYKGYEAKKAAKDTSGVAKSLNNICALYTDLGKYDSAEYFANAAYQTFKQLNDLVGLGAITNQQGKILMLKERPREAIEAYKTSLVYMQQAGDTRQVMLKSKDLIEILRQTGSYQEAWTYFDTFLEAYDSLNQEGRAKRLDELKVSFEVEKKELELTAIKAQQKLERNIGYIGIGSIVILLVMVFIIYSDKKRLSNREKMITEVNNQLNEKNEEISLQSAAIAEQNQKLESLNQTKDQLFSIISHDIRGPIGSLKTLLEFMQDGAIPKEQMQAYANAVSQEIYRTSEMLQNLFQWSNSQLKGWQFSPQPTNLTDLINASISVHQKVATKKGVTFNYDFDRNYLLFVDIEAVTLIFRNLIANSIKFSQPDGIVNIGIESDKTEGMVTISVTDTGVGIPDEMKPHIFSSKRISTHGTLSESGSGLGLYISKEIADAMGCPLSFSSTEGKGTTFFLSCPKL